MKPHKEGLLLGLTTTSLRSNIHRTARKQWHLQVSLLNIFTSFPSLDLTAGGSPWLVPGMHHYLASLSKNAICANNSPLLPVNGCHLMALEVKDERSGRKRKSQAPIRNQTHDLYRCVFIFWAMLSKSIAALWMQTFECFLPDLFIIIRSYNEENLDVIRNASNMAKLNNKML